MNWRMPVIDFLGKSCGVPLIELIMTREQQGSFKNILQPLVSLRKDQYFTRIYIYMECSVALELYACHGDAKGL